MQKSYGQKGNPNVLTPGIYRIHIVCSGFSHMGRLL